MGAMILSLFIWGLWLRTTNGEFKLLVDVTADADTLNLITYLAMTHNDHVQAVDTVRAHHCGRRLLIEVDIVMRPQETLKTCHDIAKDLQTKLESLPSVECAFVHVDYEATQASALQKGYLIGVSNRHECARSVTKPWKDAVTIHPAPCASAAVKMREMGCFKT